MTDKDPKMPNRNKSSELIKYLVSEARGEFVIEVPANWKLTFGAVNPGANNMDRHNLHCLRVWEGEKLRGVYCDVRGFRDLSIPLARKVEKQTGSAEWTMDSSGNFESTRKVEVDAHFRLEEGDDPFASPRPPDEDAF